MNEPQKTQLKPETGLTLSAAPCWAAFRVECNTGDGWVTLCHEPTLNAANRVADFMRRAQPAPGCVRVVAMQPNK